jgi:hypothetical protein
MTLSSKDIKNYNNNGYLTPTWQLPINELDLLKQNINKIIEDNPKIRPEQIVCPHIKGGTKGELININYNYFLKLAHTNELIDMVKLILGNDIILWGSQIFCKPAYDGMEVPMHQDAHYWPIEPMSTCSIWIAADKASKINGCLTVIKSSHKNKTFTHYVKSTKAALNARINNKHIKNIDKEYIILEPGQISLHHANIIHGSNKNNSPHRRAGIVYRYMSSRSTFNRKVKDHNQKDGHSVNYSERPIWLINGNKGNNTLVKDYR